MAAVAGHQAAAAAAPRGATAGGARMAPGPFYRSQRALSSQASSVASQPASEGQASQGARPRLSQHPFSRVYSRAERRGSLSPTNCSNDPLDRHKTEQTFGSLFSKMDELSKQIQSIESGQDDIFARVTQIQRDVRGLGHASSVAPSATTPHHTGASEQDADPPPDVEGGGHFDDGLSSFGEGANERRSAYASTTSENVVFEYCGCTLRRECADLRGASMYHKASLGGMMSDARDEAAMTSTRADTAIPLSARRAGRRPSSFRKWRRWPEAPSIRPIHPDSVTRLWLDVCSMTVLLFDSISVPYQLSFEPRRSMFFMISNWLTLVVWTVDIVLGFISGYYDRGGVELRLKRIAAHYIRTLFFIDLVTVSADWISIALESAAVTDNAMMFTLFRVLKLNRLVRLVAALHSGKIGQMYDRIVNWSRHLGLDHQLHFFLNVLQLVMAILWLNHIGCCMWNGVETDAVQNWAHSEIGNYYSSDQETDEWQYLLGFYWAMTSMVSGASIMSPTTVWELRFTICYVLFGLLVGSTLISSLAAMLLNMQMTNREQRDNVRLLRQYLFQQRVEVGLALDVEKEVVARMSKEKHLGAAEVPCLGMLSPAMRSALHYAIYCRPLKEHPFLGVCHILDKSKIFTKDICEDAIYHEIASPGAQVFPGPDGDQCDGPYFVVLGELEYLMKESSVESANANTNVIKHLSMLSNRPACRDRRSTMVSSGQWLCELATWLEWRHRGSLNANTPSEYLQIKSYVLLKLLMRFEHLRWLAWEYASALCHAADSERTHQLTDLPLREDLHESVVLSMNLQGRRQMSASALKLLRLSNHKVQAGSWRLFNRKPYADLWDQVDEGKCDLVMRKGQVMRIVSVVVLRLERKVEKDGQKVRQILAQISKSTRAEDAKCQLPGGKVRAGELPCQALERILKGQLHALSQVGLTADDLQMADNSIELTEEANPGDIKLEVSSLADLLASSVVQIGGERVPETRVVVAVDPHSSEVELDRPLERHHGAGSRVTLARVIKRRTSGAIDYADSLGVDTKYIRTEFFGDLDAKDEFGRVMEPRPQDVGGAVSDLAADYCTLLLLPGEHTCFRSTHTLSAENSAPRNTGILCAWIDEDDFVALSTQKDGRERVKRWVRELQVSIQECQYGEHADRSVEIDDWAHPPGSLTLPIDSPTSLRQPGGGLDLLFPCAGSTSGHFSPEVVENDEPKVAISIPKLFTDSTLSANDSQLVEVRTTTPEASKGSASQRECAI